MTGSGMFQKLKLTSGLLISALTMQPGHASPPPIEGAVTPDWFTETRIHAHTRLAPLAWKRKVENTSLEHFLFDRDDAWAEAYYSAGASLSKIGVSVFTRHAKTMDELPAWPSAVPADKNGPLQDADTKDMITALAAEAKAANTHVLTYYWDNSDILSAGHNPDWICKDKTGDIVAHSVKGPHLDISSDYGEIVAARLVELKQRGVAGIYLDWRHFPPTGCYGTALEENFRRAHPEFAAIHRTSAKFWRGFQLYQAQKMSETLHGWTAAFRDDPDFAMLVSTTSLPALVNREMTFDLARTGIPKTEYHMALKTGITNYLFRYNPDLMLTAPDDEVRMAFGWSLLRNVSRSAPHVWINGVPTLEQMTLAVGAVISHGGIANVDIDERNITQATDELGATTRGVLEKIYGLNARVGPLFKNAKPLEYVAVHFSENERNKYRRRGSWTKVAAPAVRLFQALLKAGVPVVGIDDRILSEGDLSPYRHIVSPVAMADAHIGENADRARYLHVPAPRLTVFNHARYYQDAVASIVEAHRQDPASVKVTVDDADDQVVIWKDDTNKRLLVSVIKPFGDVQTGTRSIPAKKPYAKLPASEHEPLSVNINAPEFKQVKHCAFDGLTGAALTFTDGNVTVPGPSPWRLIAIEPC